MNRVNLLNHHTHYISMAKMTPLIHHHHHHLNHTQIVTLSLPAGEAMAVSAKISITAALFLTYPLQVMIIMIIIVTHT